MKPHQNRQIKLLSYLEAHLEERIMALPLEFEYLPVEIISKQFTKLNSPHPYRIHYLGPRFTNSQILHKKFSRSSPLNQNSKEVHYFQELYGYQKYEMQFRKIVQSNYMNEKLQNNHYCKSAIFYRAFEGMNPTLNLKEEILFNSCFEAANLDCVIKVEETEFDLFLRIDSNTRGHTQWFYFSVSNGNKLGAIKFNICNLTKPRTLYEQGMRPYVFSKRKMDKMGTKWQQDGFNVELVEKNLRYELIEEAIGCPCVYRLSFEYDFELENDQVFFAYSIPYTYSQLMKDISKLPEKYAKRQILGRSLTGVPIPILHVTNHGEIENSEKKNVLVSGRIHPGESNSSHVIKGFIDFLCSDRPEAQVLRKRMNFFIVPMMNPDGVIMGNSRSSASGKDLNREFLQAKRELYPEVHLLKNLAYKLQRSEGLFMFFDFHGHSRRKNTFFYGPPYSISEPEYYKSRALAKIIQGINAGFRYYSCSFAISQQKRKTGRAVLFDQIRVPYVFTIESSIGVFYDPTKLKSIDFLEEDWNAMGRNISQGLSDFIVAYEQYEDLIKERRIQRQKKKQKFQGKKIGSNKKFEDSRDDQQGQKAKKSMLLFDIMEQIKQQPQNKNTLVVADPEVSSDDHDEAEDLEISKLAEFNTLIIQSKQKDQMNTSHRFHKYQDNFEEPISKLKRAETDNDELELAREIVQVNKKQKKGSDKTSQQAVTNSTIPVYNFNSNKISNEHVTARKKFSSPFASKSMKIGEGIGSDVKISRQIPKFKRAVVSPTLHRHIVSKQFYLPDDEGINEFSKTSFINRKERKKGRVMIEEYISDKIKKKQQKDRQKEDPQPIAREKKLIPRYQKVKSVSSGGKYKRKQDSFFDESSQIGNHSRKFKIEDLIVNKEGMERGNRNHIDRRLADRKSLSYQSMTVHRNRPASIQEPQRIFDTDFFSNIQSMEMDSKAMMIRTFNR